MSIEIIPPGEYPLYDDIKPPPDEYSQREDEELMRFYRIGAWGMIFTYARTGLSWKEKLIKLLSKPKKVEPIFRPMDGRYPNFPGYVELRKFERMVVRRGPQIFQSFDYK